MLYLETDGRWSGDLLFAPSCPAPRVPSARALLSVHLASLCCLPLLLGRLCVTELRVQFMFGGARETFPPNVIQAEQIDF